MDLTRAQRADRRLGWLMSLGGITLMAAQTARALAHAADFAVWWNVGGTLVAMTIIAVATAGLVLPFRLLQVAWSSVAVLGIVLNFASFAAYRGADPETVLPWVWTLEPVLVSYLVLRVRPATAIACALASGVLPAVSGVLFLGHVPAVVLANTPAHVSNVGFVAIFLGIRAGLTRLRIAEADAEEQAIRRARSEADARRKESLARLVHDDLLSVLTAAISFQGSSPPELRAEARSALSLLDKAAALGPGDDDGRRTTREALADLVAVVRAVDPICQVRSELQDGTVPNRVLEPLAQAAAEALRNSVRHAGPTALRVVELGIGPRRMAVTVRDDGLGFELTGIDPARLGVRQSILARMAALGGGRAEIRTAPGAGTEVMLAWET